MKLPKLSKNAILYSVMILVAIIIIWSVYYFTSSTKKRKAMIIVEPREHKNLAPVIKNFNKVMPPEWDMYVFHGKSTGQFALNASVGVEEKRRLFLVPLHVDNLTADTYNELFKDPTFWNQIDAETIFVFQTDAALCANSPRNIEEFTKYDYIGCSVDNTRFGKNVFWNNDKETTYFYGVGGLSLRSKSFTLKCIADKADIDKYYPEDVFYSNCVAMSPNKPENAVVMSRFCSQNRYMDDSFGVHKPGMKDKTEKARLFAYCPEAKAL